MQKQRWFFFGASDFHSWSAAGVSYVDLALDSSRSDSFLGFGRVQAALHRFLWPSVFSVLWCAICVSACSRSRQGNWFLLLCAHNSARPSTGGFSPLLSWSGSHIRGTGAPAIFGLQWCSSDLIHFVWYCCVWIIADEAGNCSWVTGPKDSRIRGLNRFSAVVSRTRPPAVQWNVWEEINYF
jgi:hypothetical protein